MVCVGNDTDGGASSLSQTADKINTNEHRSPTAAVRTSYPLLNENWLLITHQVPADTPPPRSVGFPPIKRPPGWTRSDGSLWRTIRGSSELVQQQVGHTHTRANLLCDTVEFNLIRLAFAQRGRRLIVWSGFCRSSEQRISRKQLWLALRCNSHAEHVKQEPVAVRYFYIQQCQPTSHCEPEGNYC